MDRLSLVGAAVKLMTLSKKNILCMHAALGARAAKINNKIRKRSESLFKKAKCAADREGESPI